MNLRNRFLITALLLCHQLLAHSLVTSQLPSSNDASAMQKTSSILASDSPCSQRAAEVQDEHIPTICAIEQEKDGEVYKLHGNVEIHYGSYIVRADEVTYNSDSGE